MAQCGSCFAISSKDSRVLSYWKECRRATARLNSTATPGEHEGENWTEPISCSLRAWGWPSSAQVAPVSKKEAAIRVERKRISPPRRTKGYLVGKYKSQGCGKENCLRMSDIDSMTMSAPSPG